MKYQKIQVAPSNVFFWWRILIDFRMMCFMTNMIVLLNKNEVQENNLKLAIKVILGIQLRMLFSMDCCNSYFLPSATSFSSRFFQTPACQILFLPGIALHFLSDNIVLRHCNPTPLLTLTPLRFELRSFAYESAALSIPPLSLSLNNWKLTGLNCSLVIALAFNLCITKLIGK